ncbi:LacI family DNA-binding transcriptional regulator [Marinibacterium profundimaris]|uniref:LacI family transcriptional regulator n=1 Tax=Marinibacterium profundimaris TaxID=1679460 RepID=A0A225NW19_9RHOB|nr:LacI family DNA-binding transcriptional regulator [Marinibacterium profundimaris]OWU77567.1 LacI family transcriptional regulator [Marinibacterium profundimaris]
MVDKPVRIQDVARAARVSTATVSRALSTPDKLSEETRKAVFEAIRLTGYRVNQAARNLRMQRAGAVLILVPNLSNPFFSQILAGISGVFMETDYSVLIADTRARGADDTRLVDYSLARVDGIISLDGGLRPEIMAEFADRGAGDRMLFACEWVQDTPLPSVRSDNVTGARLAIQHLYDLGHRNIAHVTGPEDNVLTHARRTGMLEQRARLGLPVQEDWIIRGDFSLDSGRDAARRILEMAHRPTAVFCASDQVAFGLISTLTAAGVRVPEDLSVVGFDDIELSEYYVPALTTIRQFRRTLGARAARLLLDRLTGARPDLPDGDVLMVDVELVVRDSTAPPPSGR